MTVTVTETVTETVTVTVGVAVVLQLRCGLSVDSVWRWNLRGRKKDAVAVLAGENSLSMRVSSASSTLSACSQSRLPPAGPSPRASSGRRVRSARPPLQFVLLQSPAPLHVSQPLPLCPARQMWPVAATPILVGCDVVHTN